MLSIRGGEGVSFPGGGGGGQDKGRQRKVLYTLSLCSHEYVCARDPILMS